jgi:hypothetical protein
VAILAGGGLGITVGQGYAVDAAAVFVSDISVAFLADADTQLGGGSGSVAAMTTGTVVLAAVSNLGMSAFLHVLGDITVTAGTGDPRKSAFVRDGFGIGVAGGAGNAGMRPVPERSRVYVYGGTVTGSDETVVRVADLAILICRCGCGKNSKYEQRDQTDQERSRPAP